jgi:hypothetical protein
LQFLLTSCDLPDRCRGAGAGFPPNISHFPLTRIIPLFLHAHLSRFAELYVGCDQVADYQLHDLSVCHFISDPTHICLRSRQARHIQSRSLSIHVFHISLRAECSQRLVQVFSVVLKMWMRVTCDCVVLGLRANRTRGVKRKHHQTLHLATRRMFVIDCID